jgi:hypothetical protein
MRIIQIICLPLILIVVTSCLDFKQELSGEKSISISSPLNPHQQGSEYYSPILGLCEDYPEGEDAEWVEPDFALMKEYGLRDIRVSIAWGDYERSRGKRDWSLLKKVIGSARAYGIKLYPYICYAPRWATGGSWNSPPADNKDWYNFIYALVSEFKGDKDVIDTWEIWNEGDNIPQWWDGTWQAQVEFVKTGAQAAKKADLGARIVFGGFAQSDAPGLEDIYSSGCADYIDVINIHFYYETWSRTRTERIYNTVKKVADVIRKHGGKQELWVAEIGYSDYGSGPVPHEKTQAFQAETFLRSYSQIAATGDVSTVLWYEVKNLRNTSAAIGDDNNRYLGALDHDRFPKPLWFAISGTKKLFAVPVQPVTVSVGDNSITEYVYGFKNERGDATVMAWKRGDEGGQIEITVPGSYHSAIRRSATGVKTHITFTQSNGAATLVLDLDPRETEVIELFAGGIPGRLTMSTPDVENLGGKYRISAKVSNIGGESLSGITGKIIAGLDVNPRGTETIAIGTLASGEEQEISWEGSVSAGGTGGRSKLWLAALHDGDIAAQLVSPTDLIDLTDPLDQEDPPQF